MEDRAPVRAAPATGSPVPADAPDGPAGTPADAPAARPSIAVRVLVAVLGFYRRWISPMFPPSCRFHPTCSAYGIDALRNLLIGTSEFTLIFSFAVLCVSALLFVALGSYSFSKIQL